MKNGYIYKILLPNGKIYIGQTIDIKRRMKSYKNINRIKNQSMLYNECFKYNYNPSEFITILEYLESDRINIELDEKEVFWIDKLESYAHDGKNGLNLTRGGNSRHVVTDDSRKRMSESHLGKIIPESQRRKISESLMGHKISDDTKRKIGESNSGKAHSDHTKQKISESLKGNVPPNRKKVDVFFYSTGEYIGTYESCIECASVLNIKSGHIGCVLLGKRKHTYGYTFKISNKT